MDEFLDQPKRAGGTGDSLKIIVGVLAGLLLMAATAGGLFAWLRPEPGAPPAEVAADPLLSQGRYLYYQRCNSCHGERGQGDGPLGKALSGPPPGDLTDGEWKHGDRPEQVIQVISAGVPGTSMAGWKVAFNPDEIRALAAYTYYLARRPVPEELRQPSP